MSLFVVFLLKLMMAMRSSIFLRFCRHFWGFNLSSSQQIKYKRIFRVRRQMTTYSSGRWGEKILFLFFTISLHLMFMHLHSASRFWSTYISSRNQLNCFKNTMQCGSACININSCKRTWEIRNGWTTHKAFLTSFMNAPLTIFFKCPEISKCVATSSRAWPIIALFQNFLQKNHFWCGDFVDPLSPTFLQQQRWPAPSQKANSSNRLLV